MEWKEKAKALRPAFAIPPSQPPKNEARNVQKMNSIKTAAMSRSLAACGLVDDDEDDY